MTTLKFAGTDNGNCRVYYKERHALYAFQEDKPGAFILYRCSRDGESSYEVEFDSMKLVGMPFEDDATSRDFWRWIKFNMVEVIEI